LYDRSEGEYRRALAASHETSRRAALRRLASRAKKGGAHENAADLWTQAAEAGDWSACRELAIYHEHRRRDPEAALAAVDRAFSCLVAADEGAGVRRATADLERRRDRLARKLDSARNG